MAALDDALLTLNAKEQPDFMKFVFERMYEKAGLEVLHGPIWEGVKMKEQIVFASLMSKTGIADASCTRPVSGAKSVLTQKYWEPEPIGDTIELCQRDIRQLFKAYYDKITSYKEQFDITGSDEETFLTLIYAESMADAIRRYVWLGDKAVVAADGTDAGLKAVANAKFYDSIDGIWAKLFAEVGLGNIQRVNLSALNGQVTTAAQVALSAGQSVEIFESMRAVADERLLADMTAKYYVTKEIWENYRIYLMKLGSPFDLTYTTEGLGILKYDGKEVINMENIYGRLLRADFTDNTTNNAYWLPNRAILTVPNNIPVGTLNSADFTEMESWFERLTRMNYMAYGFTLDAQVLEGYMAVVAY